MTKKDMQEEFKHFINPVFEFGEEVYLKTDPSQRKRIVIALYVTEHYNVMYELRYIDEVGTYSHYEITREKDMDMALNGDDD